MAKCTKCGHKASFMMSMCDACIEEISRKQEEQASRREASKTAEIKALEVNYLDKTIGNAQIREINISKHARALRFLRFTDYTLVIFCGYLGGSLNSV